MYAETVQLFDKAWQRLITEFKDQKPILTYLEKTYIRVRQQWARCFIREYPNLGLRTTSATESSNFNIKSYLVTAKTSIFGLVKALIEMVRNQKRAYEEMATQQATRLRREYINKWWIGNVPLTVSYWAVDQIARQYRKALAAMPSARQPFPPPLSPCENIFSNQYGLPCSHTIFRKLEKEESLDQWDVHPRWHLEKSLVCVMITS